MSEKANENIEAYPIFVIDEDAPAKYDRRLAVEPPSVPFLESGTLPTSAPPTSALPIATTSEPSHFIRPSALAMPAPSPAIMPTPTVLDFNGMPGFNGMPTQLAVPLSQVSASIR
jgi:hypothetical protein